LDKCNEFEPLDFDSDYIIDKGLDNAENVEYYPIAFKKLKEERPELFKIVWDKIIIRHKR
jgi:hypothetical protein